MELQKEESQRTPLGTEVMFSCELRERVQKLVKSECRRPLVDSLVMSQFYPRQFVQYKQDILPCSLAMWASSIRSRLGHEIIRTCNELSVGLFFLPLISDFLGVSLISLKHRTALT